MQIISPPFAPSYSTCIIFTILLPFPLQACVSSPLLSSGAPSRSLVSSRHGSTFFSEMDSDSCSVRTQSTINTTREKSVMSYTSRSNRQPTKRHRHRKHKKGIYTNISMISLANTNCYSKCISL